MFKLNLCGYTIHDGSALMVYIPVFLTLIPKVYTTFFSRLGGQLYARPWVFSLPTKLGIPFIDTEDMKG